MISKVYKLVKVLKGELVSPFIPTTWSMTDSRGRTIEGGSPNIFSRKYSKDFPTVPPKAYPRAWLYCYDSLSSAAIRIHTLSDVHHWQLWEASAFDPVYPEVECANLTEEFLSAFHLPKSSREVPKVAPSDGTLVTAGLRLTKIIWDSNDGKFVFPKNELVKSAIDEWEAW